MAINIKKIKSLNAFCGLDKIEGGDFKDYNVIFGNNGCGKTSLTRAFELLIPKNNHIEKYRTISSSELPNIEFEFENGSYTIEPNSNNDNIPFKVEIYNSDFLYHNAPFNKEFGLKKLDDGTIILEGSALGEEMQEINRVRGLKERVEKRQKEIKDENDTENKDTLIAKQKSEIREYENKIEDVRGKVSKRAIVIRLEDIEISNFRVSKNKFAYDQGKLTNLEDNFNKLNEAIKKFKDLKGIELPNNYQTIKDNLEFYFPLI